MPMASTIPRCVRAGGSGKGYRKAETTVEEWDLVTYEQALALLLAQCDVVAARMRRDGEKVQLCGGDLSDTGF